MNACLGVGVCTAWTCTPGSAGPVCGSTTGRQVCNADGQGYATVACAAGQFCSGGICLCPTGTSFCGTSCVTCAIDATCDSTLNRCVTAWQSIPRFSGNQRCGPYYTVNLPSSMNQFRARGTARVSGGFVSVVVPSGQTTTTDLASGTCRTAITSDETWLVGEIRSLRNPTACTNPRDTNFLATQLIGCGVYDYSLEGRRVYW